MFRRIMYATLLAVMLAGCSPTYESRTPRQPVVGETFTAKILYRNSFSSATPTEGRMYMRVYRVGYGCGPINSNDKCTMNLQVPIHGTEQERINKLHDWPVLGCVQISMPYQPKIEGDDIVIPQEYIQKRPCPK